MPTIRPARADDLPALGALFDAYRQFYAQPADLDTATRFIAQRLARGDAQILVAEAESGELLGFCQLYPLFCSISAQPIYCLSDLFVWPAQRRSGAGRQLLLAAEDLARAQGKVRLDLTTAHTNHTAQRLYESLGWQRDTVYAAYTRSVAA
ncbi:GNAT family N-acetyltransferase [Ideonella sp. DXS22W]|uniref:GNAT family N-acetyltransferase n=1 Tax=Pseudaquabacterium inlustre TaxID=2984192 RepID=A0ABU9CMX8_9BURK